MNAIRRRGYRFHRFVPDFPQWLSAEIYSLMWALETLGWTVSAPRIQLAHHRWSTLTPSLVGLSYRYDHRHPFERSVSLCWWPEFHNRFCSMVQVSHWGIRLRYRIHHPRHCLYRDIHHHLRIHLCLRGCHCKFCVLWSIRIIFLTSIRSFHHMSGI